MKPAVGKIGYIISPIIYVLLLNIFFKEEWFADAEARGLNVWVEVGCESVTLTMKAVDNNFDDNPGEH